MTLYVLRQFNAIGVTGSSTSPSAVSIAERFFDVGDTYPGNILKLSDGDAQSGYAQVAVSPGTQVITLPQGYSSANRLGVVITSDQTLKITTVIPSNSNSVSLLKAGNTSRGIHMWSGRVTSITVQNTATTIANVAWFCFEYPDITLAASWRSGSQTTGV